MGFTEYVEQFKWALQDEITAVRSSGGQKTFVSDGRHIADREGLNIYSFTADSELRFPDGTRVDIEELIQPFSAKTCRRLIRA
ncbi:MAG: hypothetical protein RMK99_17170, partial [Anaerolineales bacterium]|nr:hypothetical protein [Anaerolineales bacterium]